jgi:hypothetical protein
LEDTKQWMFTALAASLRGRSTKRSSFCFLRLTISPSNHSNEIWARRVDVLLQIWQS